MDKIERLENESLGKLLFQFSFPAIIGMVVNASYNIVDRIFVGRGVGSLAISGIAITFPLMMIFIAIGMLVGIGGAALISIRLGQKKKEEAEFIAGNAFSMILILSLALTIFLYFFDDAILPIFGGEGEAFRYGKEYLHVILYGTVFQSVAFSMNAIIRGQGDPKTAMMTMLIGAVLNTILNPIFIFGLGMGIQGSALATVISQFVAFVWILYYFISKKSFIHLKISNMKLDWKIIGGITAIGISPFAMQISASIVASLFIKMLTIYGGDLAVAAMGIIYSVFLLIFFPIFGLNQGMQPIIGYNYGARRYGRVKKALKIGVLSATTFCVMAFLCIMFFSESIIKVFCQNDLQLISIGSHGIKIFLMMIPITGFQIISISYFQSIGKAKYSLMLSMLRQVFLLIPLILILPIFFKIEGVWWSSPIADFLSALITAFFLFFEIKKLNTMRADKLRAEAVVESI